MKTNMDAKNQPLFKIIKHIDAGQTYKILFLKLARPILQSYNHLESCGDVSVSTTQPTWHEHKWIWREKHTHTFTQVRGMLSKRKSTEETKNPALALTEPGRDGTKCQRDGPPCSTSWPFTKLSRRATGEEPERHSAWSHTHSRGGSLYKQGGCRMSRFNVGLCSCHSEPLPPTATDTLLFQVL